MALEEVSFYNIVGEEVKLSNLLNQMINHYDDKLEVGETRITDFNEGSEIRNLLEAYCVLCYAILEDENEAGKLPFISLSYGTYLDRIGANPFINLPRIEGANSTGIATFTLSTAQASDIVIPPQTLLEDEVNGLEFVTDDEGIIDAGSLTVDVSVSCLTDGVDGNIASSTLTVITDGDIDTNLITVNNEDAFTGGSDYEDDDDYRERLLNYVQEEGFGSLPYYTLLAESVNGVHDVKFVDDATYTKKILVNGYTKPTLDNVLIDVLTLFSDVENKILNQSFTVDKPSYVSKSFTMELKVATEFTNSDLTDLFTAMVNGGGWDRFDFKGLDIGENLTKQLFEETVADIDDILEITSLKITGQLTEFTATNILSSQVVKVDSFVFNQTVVE